MQTGSGRVAMLGGAVWMIVMLSSSRIVVARMFELYSIVGSNVERVIELLPAGITIGPATDNASPRPFRLTTTRVEHMFDI